MVKAKKMSISSKTVKVNEVQAVVNTDLVPGKKPKVSPAVDIVLTYPNPIERKPEVVKVLPVCQSI